VLDKLNRLFFVHCVHVILIKRKIGESYNSAICYKKLGDSKIKRVRYVFCCSPAQRSFNVIYFGQVKNSILVVLFGITSEGCEHTCK